MNTIRNFLKRHLAIIILTALFVLVELYVYPLYKDYGLLTIGSGIRISLIALISYLVVFRNVNHQVSFKVGVTAFVFASAVCLLIMMFVNPLLVDIKAVEDGGLENLSAAFLFLASGIFLLYSVKFLVKKNILRSVVSALMAAGFFIICMEEISWFQRVLEIESNEFFIQNNVQQEINFHNLNTDIFAQVYYVGGFVFLVLIPFFAKQIIDFFKKIKLGTLAVFVPQTWVLLPFSIIAGFMGGGSTPRLTAIIVFILTFTILMSMTTKYLSDKRYLLVGAYITATIVMVAMAVTSTFFDYDTAGVRSWMLSEYKEAFIALGLSIYAISFAFKAHNKESTTSKTVRAVKRA